ncbi:hypothetical protein JAAARDRAFT_45943 [Jaapia argillacea MUCL 33604]|uniref:Ubiquitin-like protease family profile domain-containing protein n=1 Tax=Jaapia argillacea MUCL 33604 TaxID=933084 RepID=A0A067QBW3_9AGAM|nr:hypothetical protein JAAARDRAFT_45943 [Jaapia argillacea MUCL 33604]
MSRKTSLARKPSYEQFRPTRTDMTTLLSYVRWCFYLTTALVFLCTIPSSHLIVVFQTILDSHKPRIHGFPFTIVCPFSLVFGALSFVWVDSQSAISFLRSPLRQHSHPSNVSPQYHTLVKQSLTYFTVRIQGLPNRPRELCVHSHPLPLPDSANLVSRGIGFFSTIRVHVPILGGSRDINQNHDLSQAENRKRNRGDSDASADGQESDLILSSGKGKSKFEPPPNSTKSKKQKTMFRRGSANGGLSSSTAAPENATSGLDAISVEDSQDTVADESPPPFDPLCWISQGKRYKDVPMVVSLELCRCVSLPTLATLLLPPNDMPILDLLNFTLPCILGSFQLIPPTSCFSSDTPNTGFDSIITQPIPPREFVEQLRAAAGQAMLDGMLSIRSWRDKVSPLRLPFSVMSFWLALHVSISAKDDWARAAKWLGSFGTPSQDLAKACAHSHHFLSVIPWNQQILSYGHVGEFAQMLRNGFLSDIVINAMIRRINSHLKRSPSPPAIVITTLQLSTYLVGNTSLTKKSPSTHPPYNAQSVGYLQDMGRRVTESACTRLLFPFYSPPHHWAVISIDIPLRTIRCGDSIGRSCPKVLVTALIAWLRHHFGGRPFTFSNNLPCADQGDDSVSCGIIAINTLKHHAFGEVLWSKTNRELLRIEEFNNILGDFVDSLDSEGVSLCSAQSTPVSVALTAPPSTTSSPLALSPPCGPSSTASLVVTVDRRDNETTPASTALTTPPSTTSLPFTSPPPSELASLMFIVDPRNSETTPASTAPPSMTSLPFTSPSPSEPSSVASPTFTVGPRNSKTTPASTTAPSMTSPPFTSPPPSEPFSVASLMFTVDPRDNETTLASTVPPFMTLSPFTSPLPSEPANVASPSSTANPWDNESTSTSASLSAAGCTPVSPSSSIMSSPLPLPSPSEPSNIIESTSTSDIRELDVETHLHPRCNPAPSPGCEDQHFNVLGKRAVPDPTLPPTKRVCAKKSITPSESTDFGPVGISRSAVAAKVLMADVAAGTHTIDKEKWENYIEKILAMDPDAEVEQDEPLLVRHSVCGKDFKQWPLYDTGNFKKHLEKCKRSTRPAGGTHTISFLFKSLGRQQSSSSSIPLSSAHATRPTASPSEQYWPCPGLSEKDDSRIPVYLSRTQVSSAGGKSALVIARQYFPDIVKIKHLSDNQRDIVDLAQKHSHTWRNDHIRRRIFSIRCSERVLQAPRNSDTKPCVPCFALLKMSNFKTALNRKEPNLKNKLFTPDKYLVNPEISKVVAKNPALQGILSESLLAGKFDKAPVFTELLQVMADVVNREDRGIGLRNMHYPTNYDQWAHTMQIIAPRAYRQFKNIFPSRSERSHRERRSMSPKFRQGIHIGIDERLTKYCSDYNYPSDAPLAQGADDTKLHHAFRPSFAVDKGKWFIYGSIGQPFEVADPAELQAQLDAAESLKADKIPLPYVPPLVLAVEPIGAKTNATQLASFETKLLSYIIPKFTVISIASDGAAPDNKHLEYRIPHPGEGMPPLIFSMINLDGAVLTIIQDPSHCLKTLRNNLFSGARLLVLGQHPIYYEQIRNMAFDDAGPLYRRDVEKLDHQDDRAASRLFSATALKYLVESYPDNLGLAAYLFVFGDMVDAYQNRAISHLERAKMDIWKTFLQEAGYPKARYYISQEADDISDILINGYISLLIIHRDHLERPHAFPLLPWLHGTSPNEHAFGTWRSVLEDPTMLDILHLVPKTDAMLQSACQVQYSSKADFKKTASGYHHTYFSGEGANLHVLAEYPSDSEIADAAKAAFEEAMMLWDLLGYDPSTSHSPSLPSQIIIDSSEAEDTLDEEAHDGNDGEAICNTEESLSPNADLQAALDESRRGQIESPVVDTCLDECSYAAVALSIQDLAQITSLPEDDPETLAIIRDRLGAVLSAIAKTGPKAAAEVKILIASTCGPASSSPSHPTSQDILAPIDLSGTNSEDTNRTLVPFSLSPLVALREGHQTTEARDGVRTRSTTVGPEQILKASSVRLELARKIWDVIRRDQAIGTQTGLARQQRYGKAAAGSALETQEAATGNTENARLAAQAGAGEIVRRRRTVFKGLKCCDTVSTAKIDRLTLLENGAYGIVIVDGELMIGKVLTMYEKGGGKNGKHAWVSSSSTIGAISYLAVQLWHQSHASPRQFRGVHGNLSAAGLIRFAHLPPGSFLSIIPDPSASVNVKDGGRILDLTAACYATLFSKLLEEKAALVTAVKKLNNPRRKKDAGEASGGES